MKRCRKGIWFVPIFFMGRNWDTIMAFVIKFGCDYGQFLIGILLGVIAGILVGDRFKMIRNQKERDVNLESEKNYISRKKQISEIYNSRKHGNIEKYRKIKDCIKGFSTEERETYKLEWIRATGIHSVTEFIKSTGSLFFSLLAFITAVLGLEPKNEINLQKVVIENMICIVAIVVMGFILILLYDAKLQSKGKYVLDIVNEIEKSVEQKEE